jgi:uncharacterized protein YndB with AHSA1/START domain
MTTPGKTLPATPPATTSSTSGDASASAPSGHELLITRTFDAPIALVFQLWESREHMLRWWGPKDFTCTHLELDFRPGGSYRACIASAQHGDNWMRGRFLEIEKPRRIAMTFSWEHGRDQPGVEMYVTVTFTEEDGRTVQRFHQAPFLHADSRDSHIGGWNECFDREQAYVEELAR